MRIYLSNKMAEVPYFNAPWFDKAAAVLRSFPEVLEVFNPADNDRENGFDPMLCPNGSFGEAILHGFSLTKALRGDWLWIADHADCVVTGPDWIRSRGAISEVAAIQGLRKPAYTYEEFVAFHGTPYLLSHQLPTIMELIHPERNASVRR